MAPDQWLLKGIWSAYLDGTESTENSRRAVFSRKEIGDALFSPQGQVIKVHDE